MPTNKQKKGAFGEEIVRKICLCPRCKRKNTLKRLPNNFKCSDIICDFCGFLAQVKTIEKTNIDTVPSKILGAAWGPQKKRMDSEIYFSLYLVILKTDNWKKYAVYYLPAELQKPGMFIPRKKLSVSAKRAGWQGFYYLLSNKQKELLVKIH